jgi:predicted ATPase/class 3 adenylate cyclase/DNA-binding CsgD family transcriptional regulator
LDSLPVGTVTLLFTDIEGSTRLLQKLGERYVDVLAECRSLLRAMFQDHHGYEVDTQGDAFFVAFARASDAVLAAAAAQRALFHHPWPGDITVRVRMGLHTGEPQSRAEGYVGLDVHHAARIMSAAHGGQVLLSQTTAALVASSLSEGVRLVDLGVHRLKDLQQPGHLFQLVIAGLPTDFPPLNTLDAFPNNLPVQLTPLIRREQELAAVIELLRREEVHLVTLTGPGGTGKTGLGLQVAAELSDSFADGVFFVNLAPLGDAEFVVPAIAQTLAIKETADQPILELLKASLREKRLLLLLDNFEQVVDAALQVAELLSACPKLKILVTSRMALHLRAEQEFAVPPLTLPDPRHLPDLVALSQYEAVVLFIERARAVKPDFQVTNATAPAIAEICVRLDGLPLAIELAAARIKLLSPQALLARLDQRLDLLTSGARDVPARQQTLRKAIEWSYHLLDAREQGVFRRLCVFAGGCTFEAAEVICAASGDTSSFALDIAESLIDKNLLRQTTWEGEEPRLTMLETIRAFGLEALAACDELQVCRAAHAAYYLALAEAAEAELGGPQQAVWLQRLEREHDNLRAALAWSLEMEPSGEGEQRRRLGLRLGTALRPFWLTHAHLIEGRTFLERLLAASAGANPAERAKALIAAADLALFQGEQQRGEKLAEEALALCKQVGDRMGTAFSLYLLGSFVSNRYEYARARSLLEQSVALFRELGHKERLGWSLYALGWLDYAQGAYEKARVLFEESLACYRAAGNRDGMAGMLYWLAQIHFYAQGDADTARALSEQGRALLKDLDNRWAMAYALNLSGRIALFQGDSAVARSLAQESLALFRDLGIKGGIAAAHALMAQIEAHQGNYPAARSLYEESLALARETDDTRDIASYLEEMAEVVAAQGEGIWAARLWGRAEALRETIGMPIPPVFRSGYERAVEAARMQVGAKAFEAAWSEGRGMTLEQVLVAPASMPTPAGRSSALSPPGLTAREVEVLRLVAQGLTDAQVAERLVISPRTVNTHLTSIYNKLGVDSRAAATRFAVEHRLV